MDGIQPFGGPQGGPAARFAGSAPPHPHAHLSPAPTLAKSPADYLRALRRRIWLVLILTLAIGGAGAVWTLRRPAIFKVTAQVLIEPPQFDAVLTSIVSHQVGRHDPQTIAAYVPNRLALLRSRGMAERVVSDPSILRATDGAGGDLAQEITGSLQVRQIPQTQYFDISLEGTDPARITLMLNTLLHAFKEQTGLENTELLDKSKSFGAQSLGGLQKALAQLDQKIDALLKDSSIFAPGGKNLLEEEYVAVITELRQGRARHSDLLQQSRLGDIFPQMRQQPPSANPRDAQAAAEVAELLRLKKKLTKQLQDLRRIARNFDGDPAAVYISRQLAEVMAELRRLQVDAPDPLVPDIGAIAVSSSAEELNKLEQEVKALLKRLQGSMPDYQKYLALLEQRAQLVQRINAMQARLSDFDMLTQARKEPVTIVQEATEPTVPIKPNRPMMIAVLVLVGLAVGSGLVGLLEYLDQSVKVPEHLTAGLTLPLYGVIPRIRRLAHVHRGGHLWTDEIPGSLEADAYRNLRASLLGASSTLGPIVTLLVTSAKPGEGKSTTALNLAATCARAGERTLLVDVDLRRPSLADVFGDDGHGLGLADILHGDLPWQRVVARTDIPNLDFLPTGETAGVPIEVLGTLELRQLLSALSSHYDRVILDGPAVLGMADCRMLGQFVDAALLVVRCGAHDLRPLQRAKAMLEQSQIVIAGAVFNGLSEDLKNWSSYGSPYVYGEGQARSTPPPRGLPAPAMSAEEG